MSKLKEFAGAALEAVQQSGALEQFKVDAGDFESPRETQASTGTQMTQEVASMGRAAEVLNRSVVHEDADGRTIHVISPVVIPKDSRSFLWTVPTLFLVGVGVVGSVVAAQIDFLSNVFGWHYWTLVIAFVAFKVWQNSYVSIPDGCQALITKFGKLETTASPGRTWLVDPRKKIGYIVNTTKLYPYNAPIRQAPTAGRVNASVDLFLQFKIEDPQHFIFTLGGVNGFAEKLENAVSEVTRALIYEQKAEAIYDLVGESTEPMLEALNRQFLPAVRLVSANITHAEPSNADYRKDLAAAEIVRVAKEAYNYNYELQLRKQQDEGDLEKELASLKEKLSEIRAEIAGFQAQIDIAREKETNRANAYARQLMTEVKTEAKANAALLEAQALDIRALSSADYPEILEYRFRQKVLQSLEAVAGKLPRILSIGAAEDVRVDYLAVARQMLGIGDETLFTPEEIERLRQRVEAIAKRIDERDAELQAVLEEAAAKTAAAEAAVESAPAAG